jgi:hypothetical protein
LRIVVAVLLLIDELARPAYRPILDWIATRRFMERFAAAIAPLPRFVILVLFAIPFAIAEPLKLLALLLVARGLVVPGIVLLVLAYLVSFLVVERIYHAGREKLLTYWWFAWAMKQIVLVRNIMVAFRDMTLRTMRAWLER